LALGTSDLDPVVRPGNLWDRESEQYRRREGEERMADPIVFPGTVDWSGENPGISLKESPDGPFTTLASLFRVVLSPHGRGHMLMLMQSPQEANPPAERANLCLTDNDALAHYLVDRFVTNFRAFKGLPGMQGLRYRRLDSIAVSGDAVSTYTETLKAGDLNVQLSWNGLGKPFCFALRPEESSTGSHYMPSVFVGCQSASITVNGRVLPGQPMPREVAGHSISTALLAFCESWIRV
jgi:hypothetical protein